MEPYAGMRDILLSYDTDISFENGDLMTCNGIDFIEREIYKVLITKFGDWKLSPNIGIGLSKFIGRENTRELAKAIESTVEENLAYTVYPGNISCRVVPTGYHSVTCIITVMILDFTEITVPFEMNFTSGRIDVLKKDRSIKHKSIDEYKLNNFNETIKPNKYWERMRR